MDRHGYGPMGIGLWSVQLLHGVLHAPCALFLDTNLAHLTTDAQIVRKVPYPRKVATI